MGTESGLAGDSPGLQGFPPGAVGGLTLGYSRVPRPHLPPAHLPASHSRLPVGPELQSCRVSGSEVLCAAQTHAGQRPRTELGRVGPQPWDIASGHDPHGEARSCLCVALVGRVCL